MDEGRPRTLRNYEDGGNEPFRRWITRLRDFEGRARIQIRLNRIRNAGDFGKWKPLRDGNGVCELVFDFSPGYRVYFAEDSADDVIILLWGGDKSTQDADIEKAKRFWSQYNA